MKIYLLHLPKRMRKLMLLQAFDRTSYLFSATSNIESNIKRLLNMVETPYFTEETVNKEKGIIAEEIKMYQEQPGYKLMFNTLRAMYSKHPIRVDIAGSVESIYEITKMIYIYAMRHFIIPLIWCCLW